MIQKNGGKVPESYHRIPSIGQKTMNSIFGFVSNNDVASITMQIVIWSSNFLFLLIALACAPMPSENEEEDKDTFPIRLSLETDGRVQAVYSGEPIRAIVHTDDSIYFNQLAWHTGMGKYRIHDDDAIKQKKKRFIVDLLWENYPQRKDTACECYYDTVYVSMGGNVKISNTTHVTVTNLTPVIDSVVIADTGFSGQDTSYAFSVSDSMQQISIRVFARDLDSKTLVIGWWGDNGRIKQNGTTNELELFYAVPEGDFRDTIIVNVYDRAGGQALRTLQFSRISPNTRPIIDSVIVDEKTLKGSSRMFRTGFPTLDTVKMQVYTHDKDRNDALSISWSTTTTSWIRQDPNNKSIARFVCMSEVCGDTLDDSIRVVDTIVVRVTDKRGASATKSIELLQGTINTPPAIHKIRFGDSLYQDDATTFTRKIRGPAEYPVRIYIEDPDEKDVVNVEWKSNGKGFLTQTTDTSAVYNAADEIMEDTITITATDGKGITTKRIAVSVYDILPVIDSIEVGIYNFQFEDDRLSFMLKPGDTLRMSPYVRDIDQTDTLSISWEAPRAEKFLESKNTAIYICADSLYMDTISIAFTDGDTSLIRYISIDIGSSAPVIDSIVSADTTYSGWYIYSRLCTKTEKIQFNVYVNDDDRNDTLRYIWDNNVENTISWLHPSGKTILYSSLDSVYVDTLIIKVEDRWKNKTQKEIEIKVGDY